MLKHNSIKKRAMHLIKLMYVSLKKLINNLDNIDIKILGFINRNESFCLDIYVLVLMMVLKIDKIEKLCFLFTIVKSIPLIYFDYIYIISIKVSVCQKLSSEAEPCGVDKKKTIEKKTQ
ncbi:hypothetical protein CDIK_3206 [Cucumispora dikerogammari]|nr:hypothetical protein CDIK_3206 [Cucumispora dikerogammari]